VYENALVPSIPTRLEDEEELAILNAPWLSKKFNVREEFELSYALFV